MADENDSDFFAREEESTEVGAKKEQNIWKVLIVDDEQDIHNVTKLAFEDFSFEQKNILFLSAFSVEEAKKLIQEHPDTALILLDVVMEEDDSGLQFVKYLREELKNNMVRIILRTGQPGHAPEKKVVIDYDINDYKEKSELTVQKFYTAVVLALRSFRDLSDLEAKKKEVEKSSEIAEQFMPKSFLKLLNKDSISNIKLGDYIEQEMTILFMDIRSFSTLSEKLSPIDTFQFINSCLSYLEPAIIEYQGFIDKYIGDSIMALFVGNADKALSSSISMLKALNKYNRQQRNGNSPSVQIGISLHTGIIVAGMIGLHDRIDCTAVSDAVDIAAKIEQYSKDFGSQLLITEEAFSKLSDSSKYKYRRLGNIQIPGKTKSTGIYEIYDSDPQEIQEVKDKTKADFEKAVNFYNSDDFKSANSLFKKICDVNPDDKIAKFFADSSDFFVKKEKVE